MVGVVDDLILWSVAVLCIQTGGEAENCCVAVVSAAAFVNRSCSVSGRSSSTPISLAYNTIN